MSQMHCRILRTYSRISQQETCGTKRASYCHEFECIFHLVYIVNKNFVFYQNVRCFECNAAISYNSCTNQLAMEVIRTFEKWNPASIISSNRDSSSPAPLSATLNLSQSKVSSVFSKSHSRKPVYCPGLSNLGNTCFFNSVMQVHD